MGIGNVNNVIGKNRSFLNHPYSLLLLVLSCLSNPVIGIDHRADARSLGLGGSGVMLPDQTFGMSNPASLSTLERICFSLHAENPFFIPELATGALSLCIPSKTGTFAITHCTGGYEAYRESNTSFVFGKALGKRFSAGIELNYCHIRQYGEYGSFRTIVPALGIHFQPVTSLVLGLYLDNPAGQPYYPKGYRKVPTVFRAGLGYHPGEDILLCAEYVRETGREPVYCGGVECACGRLLLFRLGVSSAECRQYSFGLGLRLDHLKTDLAVSHHPILGYSPAITLIFNP